MSPVSASIVKLVTAGQELKLAMADIIAPASVATPLSVSQIAASVLPLPILLPLPLLPLHPLLLPGVLFPTVVLQAASLTKDMFPELVHIPGTSVLPVTMMQAVVGVVEIIMLHPPPAQIVLPVISCILILQPLNKINLLRLMFCPKDLREGIFL
ncbi:MAG: hypothetical protein PHV63_04015 [Candidatus Daviesbacteria bacterium]|nr:hypothetical protein [Candidatus Daviesbacteria bacterium]